MKTTIHLLSLLSLLITAVAGRAEQKAEPISLVFSIQVRVEFDYDHFSRSSVTGESTTKDRIQLSGPGYIDHQPDPNDVSFYLTLTDANGDRIVLELAGKGHPLEISELLSVGYYSAKAGGVYKVAEATGRYAGLKDRGTFLSDIKYYPVAHWYDPTFRGEGTLTLMGSSPIQLGIKAH